MHGQMEADPQFKRFVFDCFTKHLHGEWGKVPPEDKEQNEWSLQHGARLMSAYEIPGREGQDIWIITEADRSSTTILFPNEY